MESIATHQLSALSHPQRLALFRLLVRRYPDAVPAGEIAAALGAKANTTSVYLSALTEAGLATKRREGTSLLYRADLNSARDLVQFLFSDCCRGRLDLCLPETLPPTRVKLLFTCSGNSARSLCAEVILRKLRPSVFDVYSAGTNPAPAPNPLMLSLLKAKGHDTDGLQPKDVAQFREPGAASMDVVITLCDRAANEECPPWTGFPLTSHWSLPDPTALGRRLASPESAFAQIYETLHSKIERLVQIDLRVLSRVEAQSALDAIADSQEDETTK